MMIYDRITCCLCRKVIGHMTNKHFNIEDRYMIFEGVSKNLSMRKIADFVNASASTVSRELEKHRVLDTKSSFNKRMPKCTRILKAPWICNGCPNFSTCRNLKYRYSPSAAQQAYEATLHESRRKIRTGSTGIHHIDHIVTPLIRDQGQTIAHVFNNHSDELGISRSTFYRYVDDGKLTIRNIDLPERVRFPKRSKIKRGDNSKIDNQSCRENRDYASFQAYLADHPKASVTEMDSVIGVKGRGHKVLLTLLLRDSKFMLAFIRDSNSAQSVIDILDSIEEKIGFANFRTMFDVVLTDNGSEFKLVDELEHSKDHKTLRTNIFYCDARSSQQKGMLEKNHRYIRKYVKQGESFDGFTQKDINLMMSHINSVKRDSLGGKSPFECLSKKEMKIIKKLGLKPIAADEVVLNPSLFK